METEKRVNQVRRQLKEELATREQEVREQLRQEQEAVSSELEARCAALLAAKQHAEQQAQCLAQALQQQQQQQQQATPLSAYLGEGGHDPHGDTLDEQEADGRSPGEGTVGGEELESVSSVEGEERLRTLQERMNEMMGRMEETVARRCELFKQQERSRSLDKMRKARLLIVEDALDKFVELVAAVLARLHARMRASHSPHKSPSASASSSASGATVEALLRSLGLAPEAHKAQWAVRQIEKRVGSLVEWVHEQNALSLSHEKDALYEQIAHLQQATAQSSVEASVASESGGLARQQQPAGEAIKIADQLGSPLPMPGSCSDDTLVAEPLLVEGRRGLEAGDLLSEEN